MSDEDFYEEDEDPRKVEAIWNRPGNKGRTVTREAAKPLTREQLINDLRVYERAGYGWAGEVADMLAADERAFPLVRRLRDAVNYADVKLDSQLIQEADDWLNTWNS